MFSLKRAADAGVGMVLKEGVDGGLYVKSMSREGPAYGSGVVRVGDLLLQVGGKTVLSKPVDKVKRLILGASGTSCEFVFKRWTHGGDESVIYSLTMTRRPAANAGEDAPADGPASNPRRGEIPSPPASRGAGHSDVLVLALPADGWQSAHATPCTPGAEASGRLDAPCEAQAGHLSPLGFMWETKGRAKKTEGGLGIVFRVGKDGGMYVKSMLSEGAAFRSSVVQVGDCLRKIDGKKVLGKPIHKVVDQVLGAVGSVADVQFQRWSDTAEPVIYAVMLTRGYRAEMEIAPVVSPPNSAGATAMWGPPGTMRECNHATMTSSVMMESSVRMHPGVAEHEAAAGPGRENQARKTISVLHSLVPETDGGSKAQGADQDPHTSEKSKSVQDRGPTALEVCATLRSKHDSSEYESVKDADWNSSSSACSSTEQMLWERLDPTCTLPRYSSRNEEIDPERGQNCASLHLTLARSLSDLQLGSSADGEPKLDGFSQELLVELSAALSVSVARFQVDKVKETSSHGCQVSLTIHPSDDEDLFSTSSLSSAQLALEIQRQVADPLSPLRSSSWFSFVMNAVITSCSSNTTPVASHGTALGAPDVHFGAPDAHFGAPLLWAVPPDFGVGPHDTFFADDAPLGSSQGSAATHEHEEWVARASQAVLIKGSPFSTRGGTSGAREREDMEQVLNDLRQGQHKTSLVTRWLADNEKVSASRRMDSSSWESPRLHRCVSLPEVRQAAETSRSALDADNVRLRLRLARKEAADSSLRQENLSLREENEALRARVRALEEAEQRSVSEAKVLKGLSMSQCKEIEAFQMQTRTLSQQLRSHKKRTQHQTPSNYLSELFALEQQLHSERARISELETALAKAMQAAQGSDRVAGANQEKERLSGDKALFHAEHLNALKGSPSAQRPWQEGICGQAGEGEEGEEGKEEQEHVELMPMLINPRGRDERRQQLDAPHGTGAERGGALHLCQYTAGAVERETGMRTVVVVSPSKMARSLFP